VRDAADVLAQLGIAIAPRLSAPAAIASDPAEARILTLLDGGPADADAVVASSELPPVLALARVGDLLAAGMIVSGPDGRFRRSSA
jgi:hypothetical protein